MVEEGSRVPAARLAPFLLSPDLVRAVDTVLAVIDGCESGAEAPAPVCRFASALDQLCVAVNSAARQLDEQAAGSVDNSSVYDKRTGRRDAGVALCGLVVASSLLQSLCGRVTSQWAARLSTPPPHLHALESVDLRRAHTAVELCIKSRVIGALAVA